MIRSITTLLLISFVLFGCNSSKKEGSLDTVKSYFQTKEFHFENVSGIGYEPGFTRRDNSDVIQVDGKYYVYYTKVVGQAAGYWGTVWAAVSEDQGRSWTEIGEVLGLGQKGSWDSQATFTPNIIENNDSYYLYYTGVQSTPTNENGAFENNSVNDYTAIGVAKSDRPEGPFIRCSDHPVIAVSENHEFFDSYRVDDAVLLKKDKKFWLYYKGRKYSDGKSGPAHTQMGIAFASKPDGQFEKYEGNPILDKSHEVFLWKQNRGVACLASISCTFEYAEDGLDFTSNPIAIPIERNKRPNAPGAYRADLTGDAPEELTWGISMIHNGPECYLVRWEYLAKK